MILNMMRKRHFVIAAVILSLAGCSNNRSETVTIRADTAGLGIREAKLFNINYFENSIKVVTDGAGRDLLLVPEGAEAPAEYRNLPLVRTPVKRGYFMSTTHVGLLDALKEPALFDSVAAVATGAGWVYPQITDGLEQGRIQFIPQNMSGGADIERVLTSNFDIVFISAGDASERLIDRLDEAGINYCVVSEWMESTNFAGLEWMKFFAAFYNLDEKAELEYQIKVARLNELGKICEDIPPEKRPVAAYGFLYQGIVYTQGGDSPTARELERAGASYYAKDLPGTGQVRFNMEEFFEKGRDADVLIYTSMLNYTPDKQALLEESSLFAEFKAFKNDRIYVFTTGYYMNSAALDVKFEDAVAVFHPELFPGRELTFYTRLPD